MKTSLIKQLNETTTQQTSQEPNEVDSTEHPQVDVSTLGLHILSNFLESRDLTHYWHLQTTSYAEHKALNDYYDSLLDLLDEFSECYQGMTGNRIVGQFTINIKDYSEGCSIQHLTEKREQIKSVYSVIEPHGELVNVVDNLLSLLNKTIYLLTLKD